MYFQSLHKLTVRAHAHD